MFNGDCGMKHEAIRNTHASVVTIRGDVAYDASDNIVSLDHGKVEAEQSKLVEEFELEKEKEKSAKDTAKSKLSALGLSESEVKAIIGT
jgi:DeoR/GlpR family transcriptional regulator of sugar metabolism